MEKKIENPLAFPRPMTATGPGDGHNIQDYGDQGMTLRDYFAAAALQGILANVELQRNFRKDRPDANIHELNAIVACHWKTADRTRPLGNIPTKEIKAARQHIHRILDPLWKQKKIPRGKLYAKLSRELGYNYHTGEIKTVEEARKIYTIVKTIAQGV